MGRTTLHISDEQAQDGILELLAKRSATASICPSEVARALAPAQWRPLMPLVREAARMLARKGAIEIRQRGNAISPDSDFVGPIRLRKVS
jgi:hypothetical protein